MIPTPLFVRPLPQGWHVAVQVLGQGVWTRTFVYDEPAKEYWIDTDAYGDGSVPGEPDLDD